jgi:hypothetical protein
MAGREQKVTFDLSPKTQRDLAEIKENASVIRTRLEDMKEMEHEKRIRDLEAWMQRQKGFHNGVNWLINFLIGILGIIIGSIFKL